MPVLALTNCPGPNAAPLPFLALLLLLALLARPTVAVAQRPGEVPAIYSGAPCFDDRGQVVSAHGANLVRDKARYYLFGEAHSDTSNVFASFTATLRPTSALGSLSALHCPRSQPASWARGGWANAIR